MFRRFFHELRRPAGSVLDCGASESTRPLDLVRTSGRAGLTSSLEIRREVGPRPRRHEALPARRNLLSGLWLRGLNGAARRGIEALLKPVRNLCVTCAQPIQPVPYAFALHSSHIP